MPVQLIAVDLDGTLLTHAGTLAPRGVTRLREAAGQGVQVVIATMRALDTALPFYDALGVPGPMICMNGALIWDPVTESAWDVQRIAEPVARAIAEFADSAELELAITRDAITYFKQRPGQALGEFAPRRIVLPSNAAAITGPPERIMIWDAKGVFELRTFCREHCADECRWDVHYNQDGSLRSMGLFAPGVDKGAALRQVCERLGIAQGDVLAVGDNANDLPMFAAAGISVAVGNALLDIQVAATAVAPDHDAEGVAWAVERYVFGIDHDDAE